MSICQYPWGTNDLIIEYIPKKSKFDTINRTQIVTIQISPY